MHIVIVRTSGSYLDYKTYNCQELGLAKALSLKGWKVSIIMAGYESQHETDNDVDIYYLKYKGLNQSMSVFVGWRELLDNLNPDILQVHDMGLFMTFCVSRWAKRRHIPCVLIQGNYMTTQKPFFKQLEKMYNVTLGRQTLQQVSAVGFKTLQAERYIKKYADVSTFPTPVGLDVSRFDNEESVAHDWIKEYGLDGKKILLYVGRIELRRNPDFMLEVLKDLPDDYVLLMAGDGPLLSETKKHCHDMNLDRKCFFPGKLKQHDLPSLYSIASLFLLASSYEIYGMVIMESMYFGLPVVSSLTAGSETLINNGVDGFIIPEFDKSKWADTIRSTIENGHLNMMSRKAKGKIVNNLLWKAVAEKFEALYHFALN